MRLSTVLTLAAAMLCQQAAAQTEAPAKAPASRMDNLRAARAAATPVPEGDFRSYTPEQRAAYQKANMSLSRLGTEQSFAGDIDGASATFDRMRLPMPQPAARESELAALEGLRSEDAIKSIVAAARGKRAVLLNEAHHVPLHRAFAQKLAAELRKAGFTHLAAETFYPSVAAKPKYTTDATGYYTREPVFAGFVNAALADGWQLIHYEFIPPDEPNEEVRARIRKREEGQVRNLMERVFDKDPKARVFIFVGYAHLNKQAAPDGLKWMGALLREKLGEGATLHIDQTTFYAHADRAAENGLYRPLLARFSSPSPIVLRKPDGANAELPRTQPGGVDMHVIHPDYGHVQGRPGWMSTLAGRMPLPIPARLLPAEGERLMLAYPKGFGPDAVPVDAVLVEAGKAAPPLMVPPGDVRIATED